MLSYAAMRRTNAQRPAPALGESRSRYSSRRAPVGTARMDAAIEETVDFGRRNGNLRGTVLPALHQVIAVEPYFAALQESSINCGSRQILAQSPIEKRKLLDFVLWNCTWSDGELQATYRQPFDLIAAAAQADRQRNGSGGLSSGIFNNWRRKRDSNPRGPYDPNGFQDRRLRPLGHSSISYPTLISISYKHCHYSFQWRWQSLAPASRGDRWRRGSVQVGTHRLP